MEIVKQMPSHKLMESVNDSIGALPKPYVCIDVVHCPNGEFVFQRCSGEQFVKNLRSEDALIVLRLFNNCSMSSLDLRYLSMIIVGINNAYRIILASNAVNRDNLGYVAEGIAAKRDKKFLLPSPLFIASPQMRDEQDYLYSQYSQCTPEKEFQRLVRHANKGDNILLDWPNNNQQRVYRYLEEVPDTDNTLIISPNPKCLRRVIGRGVEDANN